MTSLETLGVGDFAPTVSDTYTLDLGEPGAIAIVLEEAEAQRAEPRPFSLVFRGPLEPQLAQGTYDLAHPGLGALALFLVPISRDEDGMRYEAVFA